MSVVRFRVSFNKIVIIINPKSTENMSETSLAVAESVKQIAKRNCLDFSDVVVKKKKKKVLDEETYVEVKQNNVDF